MSASRALERAALAVEWVAGAVWLVVALVVVWVASLGAIVGRDGRYPWEDE